MIWLMPGANASSLSSFFGPMYKVKTALEVGASSAAVITSRSGRFTSSVGTMPVSNRDA